MLGRRSVKRGGCSFAGRSFHFEPLSKAARGLLLRFLVQRDVERPKFKVTNRKLTSAEFSIQNMQVTFLF